MSILPAQSPFVPGKPAPESDWQAALRGAIRDVPTLCRELRLPAALAATGQGAAGEFPLMVPREFLARMQPGDPRDPLLRQVLPLDDELRWIARFSADPLGEASATVLPGLIQKYQRRVLMVVTGACAVHCRYCFRRHFPYQASIPRMAAWQQALRRIAQDPSIDEVVLSGGDPLTLTDLALEELVERLAGIEHLSRLRVHTRLPIMIPQRTTRGLVDCLRKTRLTTVMVVHVNHPRELDQNVAVGLTRLIDAGVLVLNQAVLLHGVNDDADTLWQLCRELVNLRVLPYYLHQLDPVQGAAHFDVSITRGRQLIAGLRRRLPGYAVPRYVQERPGKPGKTVLA